ncbi:hypothetical protein ABW19_dt0208116 [Dactylella cylindrospora]|nr:hypothetical protein ABW19_dt0208116 [Dactylella cylindrospora]
MVDWSLVYADPLQAEVGLRPTPIYLSRARGRFTPTLSALLKPEVGLRPTLSALSEPEVGLRPPWRMPAWPDVTAASPPFGCHLPSLISNRFMPNCCLAITPLAD